MTGNQTLNLDVDSVAVGKRSIALAGQAMTQAALDGHEIDSRRLGQDMLALLSRHRNGNLHAAPGTVVDAKNIAFDFAGLPAEIRNEIYRYALCAETPIEILRHTRSSVWCERVEDRWLMDKSIGKHQPKPQAEPGLTAL